MNRKFTVILTAVVLLLGVVGTAGAQGVTPQTLLPGALIPKFVDPLPVAGQISVVNATPAALLGIPSTPAYNITMSEFQAQILPANFINPATNLPYGPSWVWGYLTTGDNPNAVRPSYFGPVVVAQRNTQTTPTYFNALPFGLNSNVQRLLPTDLNSATPAMPKKSSPKSMFTTSSYIGAAAIISMPVSIPICSTHLFPRYARTATKPANQAIMSFPLSRQERFIRLAASLPQR